MNVKMLDKLRLKKKQQQQQNILDDSRTSMPALARPGTSGVEDDEYISPYQTTAKWLPWLLRKNQPLYMQI